MVNKTWIVNPDRTINRVRVIIGNRIVSPTKDVIANCRISLFVELGGRVAVGIGSP